MAINTADIITRVGDALQDASHVRWTSDELVRYLNDGIRALITARPDTSTKKVSLVPSVGARQELPNDALALISVLGNSGGAQRSIRKVDMDVLSAVNRDWESMTASAIYLHFMYDQRDPFVFYLYPPSNGGGSVDLLYSFYPEDTTSTGIIALSAQWANALLNYVLGRSYAKDAEYGGNAQAAAAYMGAFSSEIGVQLQSSTAVSPKS